MNNVTCPKCGGKYVDRSSVTNTVEKTSVRFYCHSCKEYFTIDTETGFHGTLLATFMQAMLQRVDDDVDLTVKVITKDEKNRLVEVEAVGEYTSALKQKHKVAVRRKIAF